MHQRVPAHGAEATGGPIDSGTASVKSSERQRRLVENKLVKQREIQGFKLAKLAGTASEQRGWVNAFLAYFRRFDATTLGTFLWEWANEIFQHGMSEEKLRNSEACPHLDAMIASEIMQQHHFANRPKMSKLYLELMTSPQVVLRYRNWLNAIRAAHLSTGADRFLPTRIPELG